MQLPRMAELPALSSRELISLLRYDGWEEVRNTRHGVAFKKFVEGEIKSTIVPYNRKSISKKTIYEILGRDQTGLGRQGLLDLIEKRRQGS